MFNRYNALKDLIARFEQMYKFVPESWRLELDSLEKERDYENGDKHIDTRGERNRENT